MTENKDEPCSIAYRCNAPLCPMDIDDFATWYPNEDICTRRIFGKLKWLKTQRKIARRTNKSADIGYFTHEMLCHMTKITRRVSGVDPDTRRKPPQFERKVPCTDKPKCITSPARLIVLRANLEKARKARGIAPKDIENTVEPEKELPIKTSCKE
jgi:hypothetical protein